MKLQHLDLDADGLRDVDDGLHVGHDRARRARRLHLQLRVANVLRDRRDVFDGALARARQADVHRVDAEVVREVDQPELVADRGIDHGRRLDAVAQGLVEELDAALRRQRRDLLDRVPVVD